jgi:mRNA interferase RelE/StbE
VQVNFSAQSMGELNRLPIDRQMELLGELATLGVGQFYGVGGEERFGRVQRGPKTFYRVRIGDLRFYLEFSSDGIFCSHILPEHSFKDFCFRCGFSSPDDSSVEKDGALWQFLENGERMEDVASNEPR